MTTLITGLIFAVAIIITMAAHLLMLQRRIRQLEATAAQAETNATQAAYNYAEQAALMAAERSTILEQAALLDNVYKRNTLLEQLVSRWIMSRPAMQSPRVMQMGAGSVEMN